MNPRRFRDVAGRMFEEIPSEFREGVVGLIVEDDAPGHPTLPGIWTMGECLTEEWPDGTGGLGDTQSRIVLHYGSFQNLAAEDSMFDWEAELWETIVHEILHHREAAAAEFGLEEFDWAAEQNFQRHAGLPFDPDFYRAVVADSDGAVRIEGETFVECIAAAGERRARFDWRGDRYSLDVPADVARAFVGVRNLAGGRLWVVVRRRVPWWRRWLGVHVDEPPAHLERRALPEPIA
jgi:predicted Zn-dependent protease with MMP-like domain